MSLRWKLAITFALLAIAVAGISASVSYASTSQRMTQEVDNAVVATANRLKTNPDGLVLTPPPGDPDHGAGGDSLVNQIVIQQILPSGVVYYHADAHVQLPVSPTDLAIAQGTHGPTIRTVSISGTNYRVATAPAAQGSGAWQVGEALIQRDQVLDDLKGKFLALAVVLALAAAIAGWLVATRITRPIVGLTAATEKLAAGADGKEPDLETGRSDEVGRLSRSFSNMLLALRSSRDQQHQLVRDAGHELRTPITSLRTNIELLQRHDRQLSDERRQQILGSLSAELAELTVLVDEVVELATDTRESEPDENVEIDALAERVAETARLRSGRSVTVTGEPWSMVGQPRLLERALTNLVENAIKFSPEDTSIDIEATKGILAVRDHGPGIEPDELSHIFDRFYRSEKTKSLPGSGLGLSIVSQVASNHGATTFAESADGGGARVGIRFSNPAQKRS